mmetsp:Transcript_24747/g.74398  ORF Transcript_24747/g.74398 Transcript_24747/m.74398 type:complete len:310 (-) Transcript_24747:8-937(-)
MGGLERPAVGRRGGTRHRRRLAHELHARAELPRRAPGAGPALRGLRGFTDARRVRAARRRPPRLSAGEARVRPLRGGAAGRARGGPRRGGVAGSRGRRGRGRRGGRGDRIRHLHVGAAAADALRRDERHRRRFGDGRVGGPLTRNARGKRGRPALGGRRPRGRQDDAPGGRPGRRGRRGLRARRRRLVDELPRVVVRRDRGQRQGARDQELPGHRGGLCVGHGGGRGLRRRWVGVRARRPRARFSRRYPRAAAVGASAGAVRTVRRRRGHRHRHHQGGLALSLSFLPLPLPFSRSRIRRAVHSLIHHVK